MYIGVCIQSTPGTRQLISCIYKYYIVISVYFNLQLLLIAIKKKKFCSPSIIVIKHAKEIHALLQEIATAICVKVKGSKRVGDKI